MAQRQQSMGRLALATLVVLAVVFAGTFAVSYATGFPFNLRGGSTVIQTQSQTSLPQGGNPTPAAVVISVKDAWSGSILSSSTSNKADIINPSDFSKPLEGALQGSSSTNLISSSSLYTPGTSLVIHTYESGYYDNVQSFSVPTVLTVISNTQNYFLGTMTLTARAANTAITAQLVDPAGAVDSSTTNINSGGSEGTYSAPGGQKLDPFSVAVRVTAAQKSYAYPEPFLTANFKQISLQGTVWLGINSTGIGISSLTGAGWQVISNEPTGYTVVFKQLPEIDSPTAANLGYSVQSFTLDTSPLAANKHVQIAVWVADNQNPADNALGVTDGTLSAYGAFSGYGNTAVLGIGYNSATSSGAFTTYLLATVVTTG